MRIERKSCKWRSLLNSSTNRPIALVTEGRTRDEAIERLRVWAQQRLTADEMVRLDSPEVALPHPWVPLAEIRKDYPEFDEVLEHIAAEGRKRDAAESEA
jgi:hypothetical protein